VSANLAHCRCTHCLEFQRSRLGGKPCAEGFGRNIVLFHRFRRNYEGIGTRLKYISLFPFLPAFESVSFLAVRDDLRPKKIDLFASRSLVSPNSARRYGHTWLPAINQPAGHLPIGERRLREVQIRRFSSFEFQLDSVTTNKGAKQGRLLHIHSPPADLTAGNTAQVNDRSIIHPVVLSRIGAGERSGGHALGRATGQGPRHPRDRPHEGQGVGRRPGAVRVVPGCGEFAHHRPGRPGGAAGFATLTGRPCRTAHQRMQQCLPGRIELCGPGRSSLGMASAQAPGGTRPPVDARRSAKVDWRAAAFPG